MVATQTILYAAGALTLFGAATLVGYDWMQSKATTISVHIDTPRTTNVVKDDPVPLCAREEVKSTVTSLLPGSSEDLLNSAALPKLGQIAMSSKDPLSAESLRTDRLPVSGHSNASLLPNIDTTCPIENSRNALRTSAKGATTIDVIACLI
jgi:hypothetical protein